MFYSSFWHRRLLRIIVIRWYTKSVGTVKGRSVYVLGETGV